jgi:hypothetical protein
VKRPDLNFPEVSLMKGDDARVLRTVINGLVYELTGLRKEIDMLREAVDALERRGSYGLRP